MYYKKSKYRVVIMVVLAMLLQIVGPVVGDVYAAMDDNAFRIVDERPDFENEKAYIDWEFTLDLDNKVDVFTYTGNFNLKDGVAVEDEELIANDEAKTVIGTYSISTKGEVTVNIDQKLYEGEKPTDPADEGETGEPTKTPDPVEPEGNEGDLHGTEGENGNGQEASMLEKVLTNLVYAGDDLPLVNFDIGESKVKSFKGTIEVAGAREKEKFNLFGKLMGLFSAGKDLGNIFTDVKLIINGDVVGDGDGIVNLDEITDSMSIGLEFQWELPDKGVDGFVLNEGDFATIELPAIFKGTEDKLTGPLIENKGTETERVLGSYEITSEGKLKVVFGEYEGFDNEFLIESDRIGAVGFVIDIDVELFKENHKQEIYFGKPIDKIFTINAKPSGENISAISKKGKPNATTNATAINWEIGINTNLQNLTNAVVKDKIPEGLVLDGIIEIYDLTVGVSGKLTPGENPTRTINVGELDDPTQLDITLGELNGSAKLIKYTTKITDYNKESYTNQAELYDGDTPKGSAHDTVGKLEQGSTITKEAEKPQKNADSIKWIVDVNKGQETLNNVFIDDIPISNELSVRDNSIEVYELNLNANNEWEKGKKVDGLNFTNFPIELGSLNPSTSYRIEFVTDIQYRDYKETNLFENKVELKIKVSSEGEEPTFETIDSAIANTVVYRDPLVIKEGTEITGYRDTAPIIKWEIIINEGKAHIYDALLTDTLGSGLTLQNDTIVIKDHEGNTVELKTEEGQYPRLKSNINNKMEIEFGFINNKYTITYNTVATDMNTSTYSNDAKLTGKSYYGNGVGPGIGQTEYDVSKNAKEHPKLVNNIYSKSAVGEVDYLNKTMEWEIVVDAVKLQLTELTVKDVFEENYMLFLPSTLEVYKGTNILTAGEGKDYKLVPKGVNGFEIVFNQSFLEKAKYTIKYKTSFNPDDITSGGGTPKSGTGEGIYKNKVTISGKEKNPLTNEVPIFTKPLDAQHTVKADVHNLGKKVGTLNREDRIITWGIFVNAQGRNLSGGNFKIEDTIGEGQTFIPNSLSVQQFTLGSTGELEKGKVNLIGTEIGQGQFASNHIALNPEGPSNQFTLTFSKGISTPYYIEYKTQINGISKEFYINEVKVTDKNQNESTYEGEVFFDNYDEFIDKKATNLIGGKVYTDDEISWEVEVNNSLSEIKDAKFVDTISAGHILIVDSIEIYKKSIAEANKLIKIDSGTPDATNNQYIFFLDDGVDDSKVMTLALGNIKDNYIIRYNTAVRASSGQQIKNSAKLTGADGFEESGDNSIKEYKVNMSSWGTGTGTSPHRGAIVLQKVDDKKPTPDSVVGAKFKLEYIINGDLYEVKEENGIDTKYFHTDSKGEIKIGDLPKGRKYKLTEVEAPKGYEMIEGQKSWEVTIAANEVKTIPNPLVNKKLRDITIKKVWIGPGTSDNGAGEATFTLKVGETIVDLGSGNNPVTLKKDDGNKWSYTFKDLPFYDNDGKEIVYTVEETPIDGYKLLTGNPIKSPEDDFGNFTYTFNNKNMEEISIPVEKVWRMEDVTKIPEPVIIKLVQDNSKTLTLSEEKGWKGTFTNLIKYDNEGNAINYTIKEDPAVSGFATHIARKNSSDLTEGYTVTNIELMDIPVTKKWIGTPKSNRIAIELWEMNGANYSSKLKELNLTGDKTEDATWTGTFEKVPKYTTDGILIQYGIKEVVPTGFRRYGDIEGSQTVGFTVTNMELVDVKVTKKWIGPMVAGDTMNIQLYKQVGAGTKEAVPDKIVKVTGANNQAHTFKGLDKYHVSGSTKTEITYSVDEDLTGIDNKYIKNVAGSGLDYTITNTNIEKINIPVEKVWRIENLSDRTPVEIKLKNNQNSDVKTIALNPDNDWKHTFIELFKYDQTTGSPINYTVEEVSLPRFDTVISGSQTIGYTVTNIELMDIPVTKVWVGTPKDNVEVTLYEDNGVTLTKIGDSKTLNASGSWKTIFTGIPKYKANGVAINYTVKETPISGYETTYSGDQTAGFTITNRELIDIKASKVWVNGEKVRPSSIKLQLYRKVGDGTLSAVGSTVEITGTPSWEHTWENLYATDDSGNAYTYTVDEVDVPTNYNKAITGDVVNGFIITNTYESPKKDITATKEWIGGASNRPDIWFKLYRKISTDTDYSEVVGAEIKKLTSGTTTSTWTSQDETDKDGNPYTYKVKEVNESGDPLWEPKDYVKTENGLEVKNSYNSPTDASLKAIKVWDGGPSPKPTIWFKLYRTTNINVAPEPVPTSEVADTIKELADGTTQVSWTGLKKTDVDGIPYIYSVKEVDSSGVEFVPENYKVSYQHNDIKTEQTVTNTYESPKIQITVEKVWVNGSKPEVEIELYRDGQYQESIKLNGGESIPWTYIWELDKTDKHGKDYVYTVKEVFIDNYTTVIDDSIPNKFTITNTYVIPQVEITGTKVWLGGSSTRPIIELQLYRDGVKYGEPVELDGTETTPWAYTWEDLDKTDIDGKEYKYTVDEVNIPSYYYKSISSDGLTVTNTYSPPYYPPSPGGGGGGGSGGGPTPPEPPKPPTEESKEPEKPEEKTPTEPVGPTPDTEQPVAPTEPVTLMEQPFESVTVEKDNEGDPVIKSKDIEAPIKLVEIPTQDGVKGKIAFDPETGKITADKLEPGEKVELAVTTVIDGKEIIVGKVTVTKNENGEVEVYDELIDPYGTIRDPETGEPIGGVKVQLYYADTPRNRERGLIPGTLVDLPILPGFLPNDNKNPQISTYELVFNDHPDVEDHGNYAWMVFPETDYYIVAIKEGYETFTSDIISVEWDIIKFDIDMKSSLGKPNVDVLPKTGETISYGLYLLGLIFIALGLSLRKRKTA